MCIDDYILKSEIGVLGACRINSVYFQRSRHLSTKNGRLGGRLGRCVLFDGNGKVKGIVSFLVKFSVAKDTQETLTKADKRKQR